MSAIANISAALGYDAVEAAILTSFEAACAIAAQSFENAPLGDETAPESCKTFAVTAVEVATVRPGAKFAA